MNEGAEPYYIIFTDVRNSSISELSSCQLHTTALPCVLTGDKNRSISKHFTFPEKTGT